MLFNVELVYGGVFRIDGFPQEHMLPLLFIECPRLLFPFARQIIADATRNGGFPPLMLDPIDFAQMFQQKHGRGTGQAPRSRSADPIQSDDFKKPGLAPGFFDGAAGVADAQPDGLLAELRRPARACAAAPSPSGAGRAEPGGVRMTISSDTESPGRRIAAVALSRPSAACLPPISSI